MPKMLVVTDSETAIGFRLAGVETLESNREAVQRDLEAVIAAQAYGLVVVDEGLMVDPIKSLERAMRGRDLPVLLPMPGLSAAFDHEADATRYMSELVRSAIGFDVKLD